MYTVKQRQAEEMENMVTLNKLSANSMLRIPPELSLLEEECWG